jgi:hypothetical protein
MRTIERRVERLERESVSDDGANAVVLFQPRADAPADDWARFREEHAIAIAESQGPVLVVSFGFGAPQ